MGGEAVDEIVGCYSRAEEKQGKTEFVRMKKASCSSDRKENEKRAIMPSVHLRRATIPTKNV